MYKNPAVPVAAMQKQLWFNWFFLSSPLPPHYKKFSQLITTIQIVIKEKENKNRTSVRLPIYLDSTNQENLTQCHLTKQLFCVYMHYTHYFCHFYIILNLFARRSFHSQNFAIKKDLYLYYSTEALDRFLFLLRVL